MLWLRALKLRNAINLFFLYYNHSIGRYDISQDAITQRDWTNLEHFVNILKPFRDLTKRIEVRASQAGFERSHGSSYETLGSLEVLKKLWEAGKFTGNYSRIRDTVPLLLILPALNLRSTTALRILRQPTSTLLPAQTVTHSTYTNIVPISCKT